MNLIQWFNEFTPSNINYIIYKIKECKQKMHFHVLSKQMKDSGKYKIKIKHEKYTKGFAIFSSEN